MPASLLALALFLIVSATAALVPSPPDRPAGERPGPASAIRVDLARAPVAPGRPSHPVAALWGVHVDDTTGGDPIPVAVAPRLEPHRLAAVATTGVPDPRHGPHFARPSAKNARRAQA